MVQRPIALASKTSANWFIRTGSGGDKIDESRRTLVETAATADKNEGNKKFIDDNTLGPIIFNLQNMINDIDELRRYVVSTAETGRVASGIVHDAGDYYIPFTSSEVQGAMATRGGDQWGMGTYTEWGSNALAGGAIEKVVPIGFKATGCIVYGDAGGVSDNTFRGYEGAINANTQTAQGTATAVNVASDFTTQGGADIVGNGLKTCAIYIDVNTARDLIYGGKIILETV